jgi:hypothetical protein
MSAAQTAGVVLATLLGVAGFSVSVSALSMPRLPSFRRPRRAAWLIAGAALALSFVLVVWATGTLV